MTTYTVTNNADAGPGSLRQAILNSNSDTGSANTIVFADAIAGQTITLQSTLSITNSVIIDGAADKVVVSGGGAVTDFNVSGATTAAEIDNLTIANGSGGGMMGTSGSLGPSNGSIPVAGDPRYVSSSGGPGGDAAGGIFVQGGALSVINDIFISDRGIGGQGGFSPGTLGFRGSGGDGGNGAGAIYVEPGATVSLARNLIASNLYGGRGYGGGGNPSGTFGNGYTISNNSLVTANTVTDNSVTAPPPVCFCSGTLIRTVAGECAVEALEVGDLVVTSSGTHRPIRWLGHRTIDCRSNPLKAWPVRIARDAFGPGMPIRDLYVSPEHSLCVSVANNEVLIPAEKLVNGSTVAFAPTDTVTYWHVELDSHDILLANGMPAESFLEIGASRRFFAANGDLDLPQGGAGRSHDDFCRPFHDGGLVVRAVRAKLQVQADLLGRCLEVPFSMSCPAARAAARGR